MPRGYALLLKLCRELDIQRDGYRHEHGNHAHQRERERRDLT
jgi:hypothetical protein